MNLKNKLGIIYITIISWTFTFSVWGGKVFSSQSNKGGSLFKDFATNREVSTIIGLAMILIALYEWFMYFNNFDPSKAFKNIIKPALLTWLALQWKVFLYWVLKL